MTSRGVTYGIYDVGGSRNNWVPYFYNTDAVIFPVNISGYDLPYKDKETSETTTVMKEALSVFDSLFNNVLELRKTSVILFFDRVNSLPRKLATSPFNEYFADFQGDPLSLKAVIEFIVGRFASLVKQSERIIAMCVADMRDDDTSMGNVAFTALRCCLKLEEAVAKSMLEFYFRGEGTRLSERVGCPDRESRIRFLNQYNKIWPCFAAHTKCYGEWRRLEKHGLMRLGS